MWDTEVMQRGMFTVWKMVRNIWAAATMLQIKRASHLDFAAQYLSNYTHSLEQVNLIYLTFSIEIFWT
jgi:hypothetical protein